MNVRYHLKNRLGLLEAVGRHQEQVCILRKEKHITQRAFTSTFTKLKHGDSLYASYAPTIVNIDWEGGVRGDSLFTFVPSVRNSTTTTATSILFTHKCTITKNTITDFKWVLTT